MNSHRSDFEPRRAFTLVELLVVIAIIAILIGILLPTLSRVRKQANTVKCASALREIGKCFVMYSWDNKGRFPVVKWAFDDNAPPPGGTENHVFYTIPGTPPVNITALYWQDMLLKYTTTQSLYSRGNQGSTGAPGTQRFDMTRRSIFWGCPEWTGSLLVNQSANTEVSYSENGYGYNIYPMFKASTTVADYTSGQNYKRGIAMSAPISNGIGPGKPVDWNGWHPYRDWTPAAETCLVAEAVLWLMIANPINPATKKIDGQFATGAGINALVTGAGFSTAGAHTLDFYRHGKLPKTAPGDPNHFADTGGRVQFNMLFADGHVSTINSIKEGYKAITKRDQ